MKIVIEPNFAERTVFTAVRGSLHERKYAAAFAAGHEVADPAGREAAFQALHAEWFDKLGFRARLLRWIGEFPSVASGVEQFAWREARQRQSAGMELYGATGRYAVLATMPVRLWLAEDELNYWMRFELTHLADLLDPPFRFDKALVVQGPTPAAQNLARDRYAVLWAVSVDARLEQRHGPGPGVRQRRERELARAFGLPDPAAAAALAGALWSRWSHDRPDHPTLIAWASEGIPQLDGDVAAASRRAARPGDPCPRCGFATYAWADSGEMCQRCAELGQSVPAATAASEVC
jgi:hypothetical protein